MINYVTSGAIINTKSISQVFEICEPACTGRTTLPYNNLLSGDIKGTVIARDVVGRRETGEEGGKVTDEINLVP